STTFYRLPLSALPRIVSLTPLAYTSAVSKKLIPRSSALWAIGSDSSSVEPQSSGCQPNVIVPMHATETCTPVLPSERYCMHEVYLQTPLSLRGTDREAT